MTDLAVPAKAVSPVLGHAVRPVPVKPVPAMPVPAMPVPAMPVPAMPVAAVPTPACIQPRRVAVEVLAAAGEHGEPRRSGVRQLLDAALAGVRLGSRDRQFLGRLVHWDKRNAASVASLLARAREAGHAAALAEAGLTPRQLELVTAALGDAAVYRASGAAATTCWDCELVPAGRCADHARDFDRASAYAELASALSARVTPAGRHRAARDLPRDLTGYRRRTPVAS
jgi:hypothetical protein